VAAATFARTRGGATRMNALRNAAVLLAFFAVCAPLRAASDHDKQLARVNGTVSFQRGSDATLHALFGRIDLPDDATAITLAQSRAQLTLADSSTIDIGATTRVRVSAFNAIDSANPNVVTLELGVLHFTIRHPAGGRANYRFQTPTSQIGVRGTEGYLVTGPSGTDFYCADCKPGDVTITVGTRSFTMNTGDQAIIIGTTTANANVDIVARPCANPAAIELSDGKLGGVIPLDQRFDTTGAPGGDPTKAVSVNS
jgi:FecR protein